MRESVSNRATRTAFVGPSSVANRKPLCDVRDNDRAVGMRGEKRCGGRIELDPEDLTVTRY